MVRFYQQWMQNCGSMVYSYHTRMMWFRRSLYQFYAIFDNLPLRCSRSHFHCFGASRRCLRRCVWLWCILSGVAPPYIIRHGFDTPPAITKTPKQRCSLVFTAAGNSIRVVFLIVWLCLCFCLSVCAEGKSRHFLSGGARVVCVFRANREKFVKHHHRHQS